jgi:aspartyl protease family protein
MSIPNRDDYWENRRKISKAGTPHSCDKAPRRKRGNPGQADRLRYLLYPALMLAPLCCGADAYVNRDAVQNSPAFAGQDTVYVSDLDAFQSSLLANPASSESMATDSGNGSRDVIIKADAKGHFRGTVLINNVAMPFLIDTGATDTVVPAKMAVAAKLPYGRYVQANTAGGKIAIRETSINSLKLGDAEVNNLKAQMNDHLNEVLIGMSALRYFKMSQNGDTMTLVANAQTANTQNNSGASFQNETSHATGPKTSNIKKTVSCDERKVCVTKYSDH